MADQLLGFDSLADQGLRERVDLSLARILANLMDPNTDPKAVRELTIKIKFKASEDRSVEEHSTSVTEKLAAIKPMVASGFLERLDEDGPVVSTTRSLPVQTAIEWALPPASEKN